MGILNFAKKLAGVIFRQAEAFLRAYEEKISTLPEGFSWKSDGTTAEWEWKPKEEKSTKGIFQRILFTADNDVRNKRQKAGDFCYFRHGTQTFDNSFTSYYEALSGAQATYNAFASFKEALQAIKSSPSDKCLRNSVIRFSTELEENSTLKVAVIDERVKKFMDEHHEVKNLLCGLGIAVYDNNDEDVKKIFSEFNEKFNEKKPNVSKANVSIDRISLDRIPQTTLAKFDIVVIHQGIIDKLLTQYEDTEIVKEWLNAMEAQLRYVVITTGRGTPANIPDDARVLPYSVIESSILQRFPEKMILVDTIMNLLPTVKKG